MEMRHYGFSLFALGAKAIIDLVRGSAGMPDEPWDMRRPKVPPRRRRRFGRKPRRIPLVEFVEIAARSYRWQIHDGSCDILDLGNGLRQAAVDREVTLYGRGNCLHMPRDYWDNYPLQPIPVEHLCNYWLDIASAVRDDNYETKTYAVSAADPGAVVYADLWIDRKEGRSWLKRGGKEWRGRTDARQGGPESMRAAIWQHLDSSELPADEDRAEPQALEDLTDPLPLALTGR
jgi:hypothetical protein